MCLNSSSKSSKWCLDSGCSRHMTWNKEMFKSLKPFKGGDVTFGGDQKGKIVGIGSIGTEHWTLENVYLVIGLKYNLISISQLCDAGYCVKFDKSICLIDRILDNTTVCKGNRLENLYYFDFKSFSPGIHCLTASESTSRLWHRRLGHICMETIHRLSKKELVRGLPSHNLKLDGLCDACEKGKHTKSSGFKSKDTVTTQRPLQLIHLDLCGPMSVPTVSYTHLRAHETGRNLVC